jgi:3',5'-cyclic AMP phosphodiesterase CpdA
MRIILHLSDLHFGRVDEKVLEPLLAAVEDIRPDVVVVSGDLTQRARSEQFIEARRFLDRLPSPQIVVPGNHDIPLHNVYGRFLRPLDKYRRFITEDLEPFYSDDEVAIAGVNTARSLTIKGGRINAVQAAAVQKRLCNLQPGITKIIVTHHPFDIPAGADESDLVRRGQMAMKVLAECEVELFLSGHLHITYTGHAASRFKFGNRSLLFVQAGTATSTRGRGEANSFNVLRVDRPRLTVEQYSWGGEGEEFVVAERQEFTHGEDGWLPVRR